MRKLVGTLVTLVVLVVLADFGGRYVAEQAVAARLESAQQLRNRPDVDIAGFPFLTQFASGHYQRVVATADDVPVGSTTLRLSRVTLTFEGVTASRDFREFTARRATARAVLTYADLGRALDAQIRYAGDGRIRATKTFTVLGEQVKPTISVEPSLVDGVLSFTGARINGVRDLPRPVQAALEGIFTDRLRLSGLPFDVRVTRLAATSAGIELDLAGRDLRYVARSGG